ncbi:hypothetical protein ACWDBP_00400 [Streptomyces sp. NPDC001233]
MIGNENGRLVAAVVFHSRLPPSMAYATDPSRQALPEDLARGLDDDRGPAVGGDLTAGGADVAVEREGPCLRVPVGIGLDPVALDVVGDGPREDLARGPGAGRESLLFAGEVGLVVLDDDLALR